MLLQMLDENRLKEQKTIIGYDLAKELLSNKNATWGLKVKYRYL